MKRFLFSLSLLIATSPSFAAYSQNISLCLSVDENRSKYTFMGKFVSSDWFDKGKETFIKQGRECVDHTYSFGPKNITIEIKSFRDLAQIIPDESCNFIPKVGSTTFRFEKFRTSHKTEHWEFNFKQQELPDHKYNFIMSCKHTFA